MGRMGISKEDKDRKQRPSILPTKFRTPKIAHKSQVTYSFANESDIIQYFVLWCVYLTTEIYENNTIYHNKYLHYIQFKFNGKGASTNYEQKM